MGFFTTTPGEQPVERLTPEEYARIIEQQKPHLLAIEERVLDMKEGYGELEIKLEVRAHKVINIVFTTKDKWLLTADKK